MTDTPPQNLAAERSVLGAMLIAADRVVPDVTATLRGEDYYLPAHELIHDAIVRLYESRHPIDMVTVATELGRTGEIARVGGAPYLHELANEVPTHAHAGHYAQQVRDTALKRRLLDAGRQVMQLAAGASDFTQAAEDAQQAVAAAAGHAQTAAGGASAGDSIVETIDWLESDQLGAPTPWPEVNNRTNGLLGGQMITVAARPGNGKSLIAKDIALFTAESGRPAHVATLEMHRRDYMARILAGIAGVSLTTMLRREMTNTEWGRIGKAADRVRDLPLYLDDRESQSMAQIRAAARQTSRRYGQPLGVIAIDYAQLVRPARSLNVREQEVAQISRDTKLLAKEFDCPVLLLAQLNRGNVQRSDHTPVASDLRESGAIEQDSDQVWLLHRPDQYADGEGRIGEVDLIVGKNRNGPFPITIPLSFQGHYGRIANLYNPSTPNAA
ncbi:replicative DNA helicase [Nocardioides ochotonae]|uniref:replicative DNA helicase n=1 Tax=Nocardioides ochotonae TaxID=2685869 RepID=UPI00140CE9E9|nr:replicative DNA helicase [Nocardioides ochotonae]